MSILHAVLGKGYLQMKYKLHNQPIIFNVYIHIIYTFTFLPMLVCFVIYNVLKHVSLVDCSFCKFYEVFFMS